MNVYYDLDVPAGATSCTVDIMVREKTATNTRNAAMAIRVRSIQAGGLPSSWAAPVTINAMQMTSANWNVLTYSGTLSGLNVTTNGIWQVSEIRDTGTATNLVGDLYAYMSRWRFR